MPRLSLKYHFFLLLSRSACALVSLLAALGQTNEFNPFLQS